MEFNAYLNKATFANALGMSLRTFQRRSVDIDYVLERGLISPEEQREFVRKLEEWKRNRRSTNR